jgi:hypothetical protein
VLLTGAISVDTKAAGSGGPRNFSRPGFAAFIEAGAPHLLHGASPEAQVIEVEIRRPR